MTARLPIHTRGLSVDARKRLRGAITKFTKRAMRERWHNPVQAKGNCNYASDQFIHCLARFKIEHYANIEHYDFEKAPWHTCTHEEALYGRMRYPFSWSGQWHWAVRLGDNLIIDWTARQFNKKAPFPAMWIDDRPTDRPAGPEGDHLVQHQRRYGDLFGDDLVGHDRLPGEEVVIHDTRRPLRLREMLSTAYPISRMGREDTRSGRSSRGMAAAGRSVG